MKLRTMIVIASMLACFAGTAQDQLDLANIETVVQNFARFGDQQNADGLDGILHPEYRAVVNRLFGSPEASLMNKATYLQLVRDKKIGGDERQVFLLSVDVVNNNASVKAIFEGKQLRFTTFISLIKSEEGKWLVVGDMPDIEEV
ncbi:MAG: nuclear transport factor 2 family protein [Bacteroidota bacterium]